MHVRARAVTTISLSLHLLIYLIFLVFIINNNQDMNSPTNHQSLRERRNNNLVVEEVENFMLFAGAEAPKQVAIFTDHDN